MGFIDKIKNAAGKHPDKVDSALTKAGDMFDKRTGGKHAEHTDTAQAKAGEFLTGRRADAADGTTGATPADTPDDAPDAGRPPAGGQPPA